MAEPSSAPTSTAITLPPIEPDSFPVLPASRGPASAILDFANNAIESAALRDGIKLIIVGGALEAARRAFSLIGQQIVEQFTIQALFVDSDIAYTWILTWLSTRTNQASARHFQVAITGNTPTAKWAQGDGFSFLPSPDGVRWVRFEGKWVKFVRKVEAKGFNDPVESLQVTVFAHSQDIIRRLVEQARLTHQARDQGKIVVYTPSRKNWLRSAARPPRKLESVVLPRGVKEGLVDDMTDFFDAEEWYFDRGIPHRRGYLFYGVPGSGKTSLITALAGRLSLDLCVVNLAMKGLDDEVLLGLVTQVPEKTLLLFEDIDCAFITRDEANDTGGYGKQKRPNAPGQGTGVTLSGLLNCLDGILAQEGNLVFATTNHVEALDPALKRPGRMDVWVEFKNASREQAEDLFLNFYPTLEHERSIPELARKYSQAIPEETFPVAALQGYLMQYKTQPEKAVESVQDWLAKNLKKPEEPSTSP